MIKYFNVASQPHNRAPYICLCELWLYVYVNCDAYTMTCVFYIVWLYAYVNCDAYTMTHVFYIVWLYAYVNCDAYIMTHVFYIVWF